LLELRLSREKDLRKQRWTPNRSLQVSTQHAFAKHASARIRCKMRSLQTKRRFGSEMRNKKLEQLIRRIAKEVAYEVLDEHLNDYEHKEKPLKEFEAYG